MRRTLSAGVLLLAFALSAYSNKDEGMTPANGFFLPQGDAAAGKKAFANLKCTACHWVQNEADLNVPAAEKPGPLLGPKQAGYSPGWIANSIVSPSHTIAWDSNGEAENSELSRMGDFKDTMTVRQLIDLVAYVRSLGPEKKEPIPK